MQNAPFFLKYKLHHVLFWLLVFGIWYFLRYQDYAANSTALVVTLIKVADLALMIYICNYFLVPKLLYRKQYAWFILAFIAMILLSSLVKMNLVGRLIGSPAMYDLSQNLKQRVYDNVIPHFFLVLGGLAIQLMMDYGKLQQRMAETAKEKAEAELNFLKSQINPHFLFNSINAVYFLIDRSNAQARDALHKFSGMLRYQLYEMNESQVPIEKEISFIRDFIALQQLRSNDIEVSYNTGDAVQGFFIQPLLLMPFIENAFKHVSHHSDKPNNISIRLDKHAGQLTLTVCNTRNGKLNPVAKAGGIGLANVKRRLELLYPGQHGLEIREGAEDHLIELTIPCSQ